MNIFLTRSGQVKIGDLSEAINMQNRNFLRADRKVGTPITLSPEMIRHEEYDHRTDIWSLGITIYMIAALQHPFVKSCKVPCDTLFNAILFKEARPLPHQFTKRLKGFIFRLLVD